MKDIAFITTSKGRLHHVQETLPLIVAEAPAEIVVVDYGCPQKTGDWVAANHPGVTVARVNDDTGFCLPRARNIGAQMTTAAWLCFIYADVKIARGWLEWMASNLHDRHFYRADMVNGDRIKDTWGTVLCNRKAFEAIGGYDEAFRGWGGEDDDLYERLKMAGYAESAYPAQFVAAIDHDDAERTLFHDIKEKQLQFFVNRFYTEAKLDLMKIIGRDLPLPDRLSIMSKIKKEIMTWNFDQTGKTVEFTTTFSIAAWLPDPFRMNKNYTITLNLQKNEHNPISPLY